MRTEVKEVKIFKYNELSTEVQDIIKDEYLQYNWPILLKDAEDYVIHELENLFPNSSLRIQFDVSYSQGSGFNMYGELDLTDLLEKLYNMTDKEKNTIKSIINETGEMDIELEYNNRYTYLTLTEGDIYDCMEDKLSGDEYLEKIFNDNKKLISKFDKEGYDYINKVSDTYYDTLINMLDIDNIYMDEIADINEWEYLENGNLYRG